MRLILFLIFIPLSFYTQNKIDDVVIGWNTDKDSTNGTHSFCVMDAKEGTLLKELNAHTSVIPASTLKVVTTSAALGIL